MRLPYDQLPSVQVAGSSQQQQQLELELVLESPERMARTLILQGPAQKVEKETNRDVNHLGSEGRCIVVEEQT